MCFTVVDVLYRCLKVGELVPAIGESRIPLKLASFSRRVAENLNCVKNCESLRLWAANNAVRLESSSTEFTFQISFSASEMFCTAEHLLQGKELWMNEIPELESAQVDTKIYISASDFTRPGNEWILTLLEEKNENYFYSEDHPNCVHTDPSHGVDLSRRVCDKAGYEVPATLKTPEDGRIGRTGYTYPYYCCGRENDPKAVNFPVSINCNIYHIAWDVAGAIQNAARLHSVELTFRAPPLPVDWTAAKALVQRSLEASDLTESATPDHKGTLLNIPDFGTVVDLPGILYEGAADLDWEWENAIYQWLTKASDCNYELSVWLQEFLRV